MNKCGYCGAPEAVNAPGRFYCGSDNNRKRSKDCLRVEIGLLKERVKRLEAAGGRAIENSYYPDRVKVWTEAKESKP